MESRDVKSAHPHTVRVAGVSPDSSLEAVAGWVDIDVQLVVTAATVGSRSTVFGITTFPPGARQQKIHRHLYSEEVEYLLEGSGIAGVGDDDVEMQAGAVTFAAADEWHGFENTSATERALMVWCYEGAARLEDARHVQEDPGGGEPNR